MCAMYYHQKSAVLWCIVPPPNPLLFTTHCIYVTFSVLHFCVWSAFALVHHSLHHTTRYTTPPSGVLPVIACIADGVSAARRADPSLRVAGGGWGILWTTTKRWPLASWNPPSSGWTRPTSPERGYYPLGAVKGSSAVLSPFVSVLRAGRACLDDL